jgi:hypothetical protein
MLWARSAPMGRKWWCGSGLKATRPDWTCTPELARQNAGHVRSRHQERPNLPCSHVQGPGACCGTGSRRQRRAIRRGDLAHEQLEALNTARHNVRHKEELGYLARVGDCAVKLLFN